MDLPSWSTADLHTELGRLDQLLGLLPERRSLSRIGLVSLRRRIVDELACREAAEKRSAERP